MRLTCTSQLHFRPVSSFTSRTADTPLFPPLPQEDAFHFIAYVPFEGKVYELDGLKPGPILLGEGEDWLAVARPAIQARIER